MNLTIVIQAGGESRRMGRNKALLDFDGKPLLQHSITRLTPIANELFVTVSQPEIYSFFKVRVCRDIFPTPGSLNGLYTALENAACPLVGVAACDMPFASPRLFQAEARLLEEENVDVVIPAYPKGLEPFHAVYRKQTCLPLVKQALLNGQRRMDSWYASARVRTISPAEVAAIDPSPSIFFNINTYEDLEAALALTRQSRLTV